MRDFHAEATLFLETEVKDEAVRSSLKAYLDYVIERKL